MATTRLETMLADTALVVHPDDPRYAHLIGRCVTHPFCPNQRRIPIVADAQLVDPSKGTGQSLFTRGLFQLSVYRDLFCQFFFTIHWKKKQERNSQTGFCVYTST